MTRKSILGNLTLYSLSHALVDAACAATLFAVVDLGQHEAQHLFYMIIGYDVVAFSIQPLLGLTIDRLNRPRYAAALGTSMVAAATLLLSVPSLAALLAGLGNALFHVGGGVISLNLDPGKAAYPGIYVAPGAVGLMAGTLIGKGGHFVAWPFILLLAAAALLMLTIPAPKTGTRNPLRGQLRWFETVIILLLVSIGIRGVVGLSLDLPWKSEPALLLALTSAVVLGKAAGGVLGDRFGWTKVAIIGLAVAAPLLSFFPGTPALAITGAFFFNLTMPITLTCLANMLPQHNGFAFGLTTLALIIGALPTFTPLKGVTGQAGFLFAIILISIGALYVGLRLYFDFFHDPGSGNTS
jgi:FSR family fosmidomycin resistance protein-like MFS transporter